VGAGRARGHRHRPRRGDRRRVALNLLFGIPLFAGGVITGVVAFGLLALQSRGFRPFERAITGLFAVILIGFLVTLLRIDLVPGEAVAGLVPRFEGTESLLLATGILGATVMPHVIYLHSALTQNRIAADSVWTGGSCSATSRSTSSWPWAWPESSTCRCC
jgi:NRAMP (natural resistance-associated macrophage protein)-like metal ion transporter